MPSSPTDALPSLADVEQALRASWSMETSDDPEQWSPENPALGQCAVSALVIREIYGGDIVIATVLDRNGERTPDGHAWNVLPSGEQVDFSFDQFLDGEGLGPEIVTEPVIDGDPQRAHLLARRVGTILGRTIDLPPNPLAQDAVGDAAADDAAGPAPEGHWH
jgi:hypothetical protein